MSEYGCNVHTVFAKGYLARAAQFDWLRKHGYKQIRCDECDLWAIVFSPSGRLVVSAADEIREGAER